MWRRGHATRGEDGFRARGGGMDPLPGPEEFAEDAGIIDVDAPVPGGAASEAGPVPPAADPYPGAGGLPPAAPDEPPAHATRDWHARPGKPPRGRPPKVTASARSDIAAKISLALEVPGRVWQARDPLCGGVFVAQREEIAGSLTSIVCQSPQLVAWFTGAGGSFMLMLDAMAAMWPVITVAMAHHVYHSVGDDGLAAAGVQDHDGGAGNLRYAA